MSFRGWLVSIDVLCIHTFTVMKMLYLMTELSVTGYKRLLLLLLLLANKMFVISTICKANCGKLYLGLFYELLNVNILLSFSLFLYPLMIFLPVCSFVRSVSPYL